MPDEESAKGIVSGFRKMWERPPLEALELLCQRTYNHAQSRLLLFFPEPVDMVQYVMLIMPPPKGAPTDHPQNKVRTHFLALLYMRHVRQWTLMREFVREGGLIALTELFVDENAYIRAQAVDTFMQLTSTELHDWFADPVRGQCSSASLLAIPRVVCACVCFVSSVIAIVTPSSLGPDQALSVPVGACCIHAQVLEPAVHRRFLDLAGPQPQFVAKLEANMGSAAIFPGGSYYCLQILVSGLCSHVWSLLLLLLLPQRII